MDRKIVSSNKSLTHRFKMGSFRLHEEPSRDRHQSFARPSGSIRSRRFHQPALERSSGARPALAVQRGATLARAFVGTADASAFAQSDCGDAARATRLARICPAPPSPPRARRPHPERVSPPSGRNGIAADQRNDPPAFNPNRRPLGARHRTH